MMTWEELDKWLQGFVRKPLYMQTSFTLNAGFLDEEKTFFNNYYFFSQVHHVTCFPGQLHIEGYKENEIFNYYHYDDTIISKRDDFVTIRYKGNYPNELKIEFSRISYT
ncbi:hypothetical protein ACFPPD_18715 [Cohnella suwonensis]|uniref:Uncharacterized protein n=1 Tax=Cohnella suwonensis TaxID=696072 RepID=A0ABW0LY51_9BACL